MLLVVAVVVALKIVQINSKHCSHLLLPNLLSNVHQKVADRFVQKHLCSVSCNSVHVVEIQKETKRTWSDHREDVVADSVAQHRLL